jgi:hypothetical protein
MLNSFCQHATDHFKISNHETLQRPNCYEHYCMNFRTSKNSQTFRSNLQLFTDDEATPPDETLTDTERQAAEDAQDIQDMLDLLTVLKSLDTVLSFPDTVTRD